MEGGDLDKAGAVNHRTTALGGFGDAIVVISKHRTSIYKYFQQISREMILFKG